jgi:hypothetical protein
VLPPLPPLPLIDCASPARGTPPAARTAAVALLIYEKAVQFVADEQARAS